MFAWITITPNIEHPYIITTIAEQVAKTTAGSCENPYRGTILQTVYQEHWLCSRLGYTMRAEQETIFRFDRMYLHRIAVLPKQTGLEEE